MSLRLTPAVVLATACAAASYTACGGAELPAGSGAAQRPAAVSPAARADAGAPRSAAADAGRAPTVVDDALEPDALATAGLQRAVAEGALQPPTDAGHEGLWVRLVDSRSRPLAGRTLSIYLGEAGGGLEIDSGTTDGDGLLATRARAPEELLSIDLERGSVATLTADAPLKTVPGSPREVRVELADTPRVAGRVLDGAGRGVVGIPVTIEVAPTLPDRVGYRVLRPEPFVVTSGEAGRFQAELARGAYTLSAGSADYFGAESVELLVGPAGVAEEIVLKVERYQRQVTVRVTADPPLPSTSRPRVTATVTGAADVDPRNAVSDVRGSEAGPGLWLLDLTASGRWTVHVGAKDYVPISRSIGQDETSIDVVLQASEKRGETAVLRGEVFDPEGAGAGARLLLGGAAMLTSALQIDAPLIRRSTERDGTFELSLPLEFDPAYLLVEHGGFATVGIGPISPRAAPSWLPVGLEPERRIEGTVVDSAGDPTSARVELLRPGGFFRGIGPSGDPAREFLEHPLPGEVRAVGTDGRFRFDGLGPGLHLLLARSEDPAHPPGRLVTIPREGVFLELGSGLEELHTLTGRVLSAAGGAPLAGARLTAWSVEDTQSLPDGVGLSDARGMFALRGLEGGQYTLAVSLAGYAPAVVDIEASTAREVRLWPARTGRIACVDVAGQPLGELEFEVLDTAGRTLRGAGDVLPPSPVRGRTDRAGRVEIAELPATAVRLVFVNEGPSAVLDLSTAGEEFVRLVFE